MAITQIRQATDHTPTHQTNALAHDLLTSQPKTHTVKRAQASLLCLLGGGRAAGGTNRKMEDGEREAKAATGVEGDGHHKHAAPVAIYGYCTVP